MQLGQAVALEVERQLETRDDVEGLEQLDFLCCRQVGRIARSIGETAGPGDPANEGADLVVGFAEVEDLLENGAVFALQLLGPGGGRVGVWPGVDLHPEVVIAPFRPCRSRHSSMEACDHGRSLSVC